MVRSHALLMLALLAAVADGQERALTLDKEIGIGWSGNKYGWMSFVSFSPDGTRVASDGPATPDDVSDSLTIWSFPEGRFLKHLPIRPRAISVDWRYYATDAGVSELETGRQVISLGKQSAVVFSPDSRYVAHWGSSRRPAIRVLRLPTGKTVTTFGKHRPFAVAISPDGATLAAGYWDVVVLWDLTTSKPRILLRGVGRYVRGLSFSRDGRLLASGTDAGAVQVWDVGRAIRVASVEIVGGEVSDPTFSPDGRFVAAGIYGTGTVFLIDVASGKIVDRQKVSDVGCGSVAFSPDGRFLITPSTGGLIKWPYDKGGTIRVFRVIAP